jgi:hypothetical protein
MTATVVAAVVAVVIVLIVITRNSARVKREAREDLKREMEALPQRDIMDLVREEAEETGVDAIAGGEGIDLPVRLQVWHRDAAVRAACPDPAQLQYVVDDGVDRTRANANQVRLIFQGYVPAVEPEPMELMDEEGDEPAPEAV